MYGLGVTTGLPAPAASTPYDDFIQKLHLQDKKEELAEYLVGGKEITELMQMDEDDLIYTMTSSMQHRMPSVQHCRS